MKATLRNNVNILAFLEVAFSLYVFVNLINLYYYKRIKWCYLNITVPSDSAVMVSLLIGVFCLVNISLMLVFCLFAMDKKINYEIFERNQVENRLKNITDNMMDIIIVTDNDLHIIYISPSQSKLLEYDDNFIFGKFIFEFIHPDDLDNFKLITPNGSNIIENRFQHSQGHYVWVETNSKPFMNEEGEYIGFIFCSRDISERKKVQEEIARLDRLNLIGQMAAGIGHEIRNPMTTVRGFLQMFRSKTDFDKYKEILSTMIEEMDRANSIITEYLSLARTKANNLKLTSLNKILETLKPLMDSDAMQTNKQIDYELEDNLGDIYLDENEIRQLVLNLTRNGLESMQSGGILIIKTMSDNERILLTVKDQGDGIPEIYKEKIGTPFFTTKDTGTGLGLAVCYRIANRHNAVIDFESNENGTTFIVKFNKCQTDY